MLADSLGEDAAEERHVKPEVLREGVEAAHGSEVHQTVGRLLAELNRDAGCEVRQLQRQMRLLLGSTGEVKPAVPAELSWTAVGGMVGWMSDTLSAGRQEAS